MVRSKDEILASIHSRIGEDNSDEAIALVEDINDTFDDLSTKASSTVDWEKKYNELDADWRKKYTERFFTPSSDVDPIAEELNKEVPDEKKVLTYEDLFKVE
jgi:thiamine pyrophosphate-dependent acetolactate synthase large subunit-like protein